MSILDKALKAAAGNAGVDAAPNVADVFSTYLYEGTGVARSIDNGINLGDFGVGTSTEFDGTNDYLSRSSDLTGNNNGKTCTLSAWVYRVAGGWTKLLSFKKSTGHAGFYAQLNPDGSIGFYAEGINDGSGTTLNPTYPSNTIPSNTWTHILFSCDMSSLTGKLYINDGLVTPSSGGFNINQNIEFVELVKGIGAEGNGNSGHLNGRLVHVYLDYTYRDLSTESNRRLFIDANGGSTPPATLSALNPIMYLPMTTDYSIGENIGSGGDFTSNGSPTIINKGTEYVADSGDGGLVWFKGRTNTESHDLFDTERGTEWELQTNVDSAQSYLAGYQLTSFNSDGFDIGIHGQVNSSGQDYVSWTFRKRERFFDVVTYTGDGTGSSTRTMSHDLGVAPGMIIIKRTDSTGDWVVFHRSAYGTYDYPNYPPHSSYLYLNQNGSATSNTSMWSATDPTSTTFTLGNSSANMNGAEYVAYLFAHDPDGEDDDGMIACGSFTKTDTGYSAFLDVDLGWEAQYILTKATSSESWKVYDVMRGASTVKSYILNPDTSGVETNGDATIIPNASGFSYRDNNDSTYIYMAIRAPMMVEPEAGTDVFAIDATQVTTAPSWTSGFPVDMAIKTREGTGVSNHHVVNRLSGVGRVAYTDSTSAETTYNDSGTKSAFDYMDGFGSGSSGSEAQVMFKRAKGFFDIVAYDGASGTPGSGFTHNHSLGVVPEMMIVKKRNSSSDWGVYHKETTGTTALWVNEVYSTTSIYYWANTNPTETLFTVGTNTNMNSVNNSYVNYLFATLEGVSKVGSYTGNGSNQNIDCGFSGGARFVLIKSTPEHGDWYIWDTERGIVTGNDPHLSLNSSAAEVTSDDSIDPVSAGFTVNQVSATNINVSSGTYIFLAIA